MRSVYILSVAGRIEHGAAARMTAQMCMFVRVIGEGGDVDDTIGVAIFVDCKFLRSWSKCPLTVVSTFGRCLDTNFLFNPGNVDRNPLSIAFISVDFTGNPNEAWCNVAKSFFVVSERTIALHVFEAGMVGLSWVMCTIHILFP